MSGRRPGPWLIAAAFAILILTWGTTWGAIRVSLEGFPPMTGAALRFAAASAVLAVLARASGVSFGRSRRERWLWLTQGLCTFSIPFGVVFWAEQWVPSGLVALIFSTFPLFLLPLNRVLLNERSGPLALLGMLVGFGGVALIFSDDLAGLGGGQVRFAALLTLLSPAASAVGQVVAKRWGAGIHPFSLTTVPMAITAVLLGTLAVAFERGRGIALAPAPVAALAYLALFGTVMTFSVFYWVLPHVTSTRLSLITYAIPVVAVGVGTIFLEEPLTPRIVAGGGLAILGALLAARRGGPKARARAGRPDG